MHDQHAPFCRLGMFEELYSAVFDESLGRAVRTPVVRPRARPATWARQRGSRANIVSVSGPCHVNSTALACICHERLAAESAPGLISQKPVCHGREQPCFPRSTAETAVAQRTGTSTVPTTHLQENLGNLLPARRI